MAPRRLEWARKIKEEECPKKKNAPAPPRDPEHEKKTEYGQNDFFVCENYHTFREYGPRGLLFSSSLEKLSHTNLFFCLVFTHIFNKGQNHESHVKIFRVNSRIAPLRRVRRVPSHVSGMRCVFAQTHESERDSSIRASLSRSWFCAKTQRILDTWSGRHSDRSDRESMDLKIYGWCSTLRGLCRNK